MLNYASLSSKPEMSRQIDGKKVNYKDLLCHTLNDEEPVFEGITFIEVIEDYVARPDLISLAVYGNDMYADIICKVNGISNPFELNKGMLLVIPSPDSIMDFMKVPTAQELDSSFDNDTSKPLLKTRKSKRKANEAVVGDTRFKIDKTRGIVIY